MRELIIDTCGVIDIKLDEPKMETIIGPVDLPKSWNGRVEFTFVSCGDFTAVSKEKIINSLLTQLINAKIKIQ